MCFSRGNAAVMKVLFILLFLVCSPEIFANSRSKTAQSRLSYGMAGCGGGISVFPHDTPLSQLGITSMRIMPNTVAISGATSVAAGALSPGGTGLGMTGLVLLIGGISAGWAMSPTVGITFGTSNCAPVDSKSAMSMEQELFLAMNRNIIEREAVRGKGEHLNAMSWLFGCRTSVSFAAFSHTLQANYASIFTDKNSNIVHRQIVKAIENEPYLSEHCTAL